MMEDQEYKQLRAINFDLNIDALKEYFSESNPKGAYREIKRFMESNGFEHRQWSGYCSKEPISNFDIIYLFDSMYEKMPWLDFCAERMDVTTIDSVYDIKAMRSMNAQSSTHLKRTNVNQEKNNKPSVIKRLEENKKLSDQKDSDQKNIIHHRENER